MVTGLNERFWKWPCPCNKHDYSSLLICRRWRKPKKNQEYASMPATKHWAEEAQLTDAAEEASVHPASLDSISALLSCATHKLCGGDVTGGKGVCDYGLAIRIVISCTGCHVGTEFTAQEQRLNVQPVPQEQSCCTQNVEHRQLEFGPKLHLLQ